MGRVGFSYAEGHARLWGAVNRERGVEEFQWMVIGQATNSTKLGVTGLCECDMRPLSLECGTSWC